MEQLDRRPSASLMRGGPDRRSVLAGLAAAFAGAVPARADAYPSRIVTIISPYAAGGTNDLLARISAESLSTAFGRQFIVQNVVGAGGNIGNGQVARAAPDGYTLLMGAGAIAINQTLFKNLPFDVLTDFEPISVVAMVPNLLAVRSSLPVKSVAELVAYAKSSPQALNYGSPGIGSVGHLATEMFCHAAGVKMVHVPFRGSAPAVNALIGGQIDLMLDNLPPLASHAEAGTVRAIGIANAERLPSLPSVPTIAESGFPGYEATAWQSLLAPKGTPREIVDHIAAEIRKAVAQPEVRKRIETAGAQPLGSAPEDFRAFLRAEVTKWAEVIRASGARVE